MRSGKYALHGKWSMIDPDAALQSKPSESEGFALLCILVCERETQVFPQSCHSKRPAHLHSWSGWGTILTFPP